MTFLSSSHVQHGTLLSGSLSTVIGYGPGVLWGPGPPKGVDSMEVGGKGRRLIFQKGRLFNDCPLRYSGDC